MAGSRFKYLAPRIKFGYQELVNAISNAIEQSEKKDGATVVDSVTTIQEAALSYEEIRAEAQKLWSILVEMDEANAARILKKVEMIFGKQMKLSEITEDQTDLYNLVVVEMRDMLK